MRYSQFGHLHQPLFLIERVDSRDRVVQRIGHHRHELHPATAGPEHLVGDPELLSDEWAVGRAHRVQEGEGDHLPAETGQRDRLPVLVDQ